MIKYNGSISFMVRISGLYLIKNPAFPSRVRSLLYQFTMRDKFLIANNNVIQSLRQNTDIYTDVRSAVIMLT